jgi:hypothetical protein
MDDIEIPAFLRKPDAPGWQTAVEAIVQRVAEHLCSGGDVAALPAHCRLWPVPPIVEQMLDALVGLGLDEATAWLLLSQWIVTRSLAPTGALPPSLSGHAGAARDPGLRARAHVVLERCLGSCREW